MTESKAVGSIHSSCIFAVSHCGPRVSRSAQRKTAAPGHPQAHACRPKRAEVGHSLQDFMSVLSVAYMAKAGNAALRKIM